MSVACKRCFTCEKCFSCEVCVSCEGACETCQTCVECEQGYAPPQVERTRRVAERPRPAPEVPFNERLLRLLESVVILNREIESLIRSLISRSPSEQRVRKFSLGQEAQNIRVPPPEQEFKDVREPAKPRERRDVKL